MNRAPSLLVLLTVGLAGPGCFNPKQRPSDGGPRHDARGHDGGADGNPVAIGNTHGTNYVLSSGAYAAGKKLVRLTITAATANATGKATVTFSVEDAAGPPITSLTKVCVSVVRLEAAPADFSRAYSRWVPYITLPRGKGNVWQATCESGGTLTHEGGGVYTYALESNLSKATGLDGLSTAYTAAELALTHRVSVMIGGSSGPTASAHFDFVPNGATVTETREIVATATCKRCHGVEFAAHGGDRRTVENCVTCHVAGSNELRSGNTLHFGPLIHKIHAGGELASIPGADGIVWDDPATSTVNEAGDNGVYELFDANNVKRTWWQNRFPAVLANCTACHVGAGKQVDNWKTVPSRAACGSCHDMLDPPVPAVPHKAQADDKGCAGCHTASGDATSITTAHEWWQKDKRKTPEYGAQLTISKPANGTHFVAGEAPVVTLVLLENGVPIDHGDASFTVAAASGCNDSSGGSCPKNSGFATSVLLVHGPRARRRPVLTTAARAGLKSTTAGPFKLDLAGESLGFEIDLGIDVETNGTKLLGKFSVPVDAGSFANAATATAAEVVAWLNGNAEFKARAIASLEGGNVAVRSRNLGPFFALRLMPGKINAAIFNDTALHWLTGFIAANTLAKAANPEDDDPKVTRTVDKLTYQLDPVDDLAPGTYVASVQISQRGRKSASDYWTPTVAWTTFQVKTETEEKPVAGNCGSCHQNSQGAGFNDDYSWRNKPLGNDAVDQCGACHDSMPRNPTGGWSGAGDLARRVHAIHFGARLSDALTTVGYANGDPVAGRNWRITFPQDVRHCETCHPPATTSGTWSTKPSRLACGGCHDTPKAVDHMNKETSDETSANPWSGDEQEKCADCH